MATKTEKATLLRTGEFLFLLIALSAYENKTRLETSTKSLGASRHVKRVGSAHVRRGVGRLIIGRFSVEIGQFVFVVPRRPFLSLPAPFVVL